MLPHQISSLYTSNRLGVGRGSFLGGRWNPASLERDVPAPRNMLYFPCVLPYQISSLYSQSFDPSCAPSRSLEVIGTDRDQTAAYDY